MSATAYSMFRQKLFDKPSVVDTEHCVICGRWAHDAHHVIQKGMGGVSRETDKRIPKVKLCGSGNLDGCHGMLHKGLLHIYWEKSMGGWVFYWTPKPMNDQKCWEMFSKDYLPMPGWVNQQRPVLVFGRGKAEL
ncbi:MAG: hypothetical protein IJ111_01450 [Eggerthellaceae bacterium]|nr:hypothetical protein [Eggerthellaceae bacterium]